MDVKPTKAQILKLAPRAKPALVTAILSNWSYAEAAGIGDTGERVSQFMVNICHETGGFTSVSENLTYTSAQRIYDVFKGPKSKSRFKSVAECEPYVRQPEKLAIKVYGGRMGNAAAPSSDGWLYRGGGMMQTTGRDGYAALGFENNPSALRDPNITFQTACVEWVKRGCNALADKGDTTAIRKKINGGTNGLDEVKALLVIARTIWRGGSSAKPVAAPAEPAPISTNETTVKVVQERLKELGYTEVGVVDGKIGRQTKTAILAFRNENDLPVSDVIDQTLLDALDTAPTRKLSRNDAPAALIRQTVPEVKSNWRLKIGSYVGAAVGAVGAFFDGILSNLGVARGYIDNVKDYASDVPGWAWMLAVVGVSGGIYWVANRGEKKGIEAYQSGERR